MLTVLIKFLRIGVGISNTDVEYALSSSNTVAPTEGWQTKPPKQELGKFIWSRTHVWYTDGTEKVTEPMLITTSKGIYSMTEMYYLSTSATELVGGTWSPEAPKWKNGYYIWTCTTIQYTDGKLEQTKPICVTGSKGPQGDKGDKGDQGDKGEDGKPGETGSPGADAVTVQWSQTSIIHKKSKYYARYRLSYTTYKGSQQVKSSIEFPDLKDPDGLMISVVNNVFGTGASLDFSIAENAEINYDLKVVITVDSVKYYYTIPIKTISDGDAGQRGDRGATLRGPQSWENCGEGYAFQCGDSGEEWKDVVIYNSGYYSCIKSHVKTATNFPGSDEDQNNKYWRLGSPIEMVIAKIIMSQYQLVDNLGVKVIDMKDEYGNIIFQAKDGNVICKSGTFENITASGNFKSRNPTTWNEVEMNAEEGSIAMRGPSAVMDEDWSKPDTNAELIELFKLYTSVYPDTLSRIPVMKLKGGAFSLEISPDDGFTFENGGNKLKIFGRGISYISANGERYYNWWEDLLTKLK